MELKPSKSIKDFAVIFDLDGVLIDARRHWKLVGSEFLRQMIPHWDDSHQRSILGKSLFQVYDFLTEQHGLALSREAFFAQYKELTDTIYGERCALVPGSRECAERLSAAGFRMAIASSSPQAIINKVVSRFELQPFFPLLVSSEEVGGRTKPAADVYRYALEQLSLPSAQALAIEDSKKGVASAKNAGLHCIGIRNGFNADEPLDEADHVALSFEQIKLELIAQVFGVAFS